MSGEVTHVAPSYVHLVGRTELYAAHPRIQADSTFVPSTEFGSNRVADGHSPHSSHSFPRLGDGAMSALGWQLELISDTAYVRWPVQCTIIGDPYDRQT
jgi:hypothetical protein